MSSVQRSQKHFENEDEADPGKEVFETSDVESIDANVVSADTITSDVCEYEAVSGNEELDYTKILSALQNSRLRFENKVVSGQNDVDFSDKIGTGESKMGYQVFSVDETYDQKLKRIQNELNELKLFKESVSRTDEKTLNIQPVSDIDNNKVDELLELLDTLKPQQLSLSSGPAQISMDNSAKINSESIESVNTDLVSPEEVKALEQRLYKLEKVIGFSNNLELLNTNSTGNGVHNLESLINDIDRKFKLLLNLDSGAHGSNTSSKDAQHDLVGNKEQLRKLIEKLESLNKEIILNNKKLSANQSFYLNNFGSIGGAIEPLKDNSSDKQTDKINKLYSLFFNSNQDQPVSTLSGVNNLAVETSVAIDESNIAAIIKRINTLNTLYLEYQGTMDLSKNAKEILNTLNNDFTSWEKMLTDVNANLRETQNLLKQNKEEMLEWVDSLEKQFQEYKDSR